MSHHCVIEVSHCLTLDKRVIHLTRSHQKEDGSREHTETRISNTQCNTVSRLNKPCFINLIFGNWRVLRTWKWFFTYFYIYCPLTTINNFLACFLNSCLWHLPLWSSSKQTSFSKIKIKHSIIRVWKLKCEHSLRAWHIHTRVIASLPLPACQNGRKVHWESSPTPALCTGTPDWWNPRCLRIRCCRNTKTKERQISISCFIRSLYWAQFPGWSDGRGVVPRQTDVTEHSWACASLSQRPKVLEHQTVTTQTILFLTLQTCCFM